MWTTFCIVLSVISIATCCKSYLRASVLLHPWWCQIWILVMGAFLSMRAQCCSGLWCDVHKGHRMYSIKGQHAPPPKNHLPWPAWSKVSTSTSSKVYFQQLNNTWFLICHKISNACVTSIFRSKSLPTMTRWIPFKLSSLHCFMRSLGGCNRLKVY